jgi:hypothetical protein
MWIDNDIVFTPEHFQTLVDADKDFISGTYRMRSGSFAAVLKWDETYLMEHGNFEFIKELPQTITTVAYTGLGFSLIKREALEKLSYPWFQPEFCTPTEFVTEDVYFCRALKKVGVDTLLHPNVIVGHEKTFVI